MQIAIMSDAEDLKSLHDYWLHYKEIQVAKTFTFHGELTQALKEFISTLRSNRIQLVDFCTLDKEKEHVIHALIDEGVSVLTSYPIAKTEAATRSILQKATRNGLKVINRDTVHFLPERRQAQLEVLKGALGPLGVQRISVRLKPIHSDPYAFDRVAIGQFEWIAETFGAVKRVMTKQVRKTITDNQSIAYHSILLRMEDGSFVHLDLCFMDNREVYSLELTGQKGMLSFHSENASSIKLFPTGVNTSESNGSRENGNRELAYLLLAISEQQTMTYSSESIIHSLRILEATKQSARLGQPIEVGGE
ncbi:hypothetical protein ACI2JA_11690 [Alkalihalobacillus sp. NPDC078783]